MPDEHPILLYWRAELKIFNENLLLLREQLTADPIHDIRVAIKKLRSCLKLCLHIVKDDHEKKLLVHTSALFSVLGRHRNLEISKNLLLSFAEKDAASLNSAFVFLQLLQDQAGEYCKESLQNYKKNELDELTSELENKLKNHNDQEILEAAQEILLSSIEQVKTDLKHFEEKFHLVRKQLKNVFYQAKMFGNELLFTKPQLKAIDKTLSHLGDIQDHEILISNLKSFRKLILSKSIDDYHLIKKIEDEAKEKQEELLEKANRSTEELVSRYDKHDLET